MNHVQVDGADELDCSSMDNGGRDRVADQEHGHLARVHVNRLVRDVVLGGLGQNSLEPDSKGVDVLGIEYRVDRRERGGAQRGNKIGAPGRDELAAFGVSRNRPCSETEETRLLRGPSRRLDLEEPYSRAPLEMRERADWDGRGEDPEEEEGWKHEKALVLDCAILRYVAVGYIFTDDVAVR